MLPVDLDGDQWPRTRLTLRLDEPLAPYLVAELQLEELWQVVDNVKVGMSGRAFLVDDSGRIIADGRPDGKKRIARGERIGGHPLARATTVADARYTRAYDGVEVLAVSTAPLERYGWRVIVEQPTADAFAPSSRLERQLLLFVTPGAAGQHRHRHRLRTVAAAPDLGSARWHPGDRRRTTGSTRAHHAR